MAPNAILDVQSFPSSLCLLLGSMLGLPCVLHPIANPTEKSRIPLDVSNVNGQTHLSNWILPSPMWNVKYFVATIKAAPRYCHWCVPSLRKKYSSHCEVWWKPISKSYKPFCATWNWKLESLADLLFAPGSKEIIWLQNNTISKVKLF